MTQGRRHRRSSLPSISIERDRRIEPVKILTIGEEPMVLPIFRSGISFRSIPKRRGVYPNIASVFPQQRLMDSDGGQRI